MCISAVREPRRILHCFCDVQGLLWILHSPVFPKDPKEATVSRERGHRPHSTAGLWRRFLLVAQSSSFCYLPSRLSSHTRKMLQQALPQLACQRRSKRHMAVVSTEWVTTKQASMLLKPSSQQHPSSRTLLWRFGAPDTRKQAGRCHLFMQPSAASAPPAFYAEAIPHPLFAAPCKQQWTAEGRKAHGSRQLQMHRMADSAYA